MKNHELVTDYEFEHILYEHRPVKDKGGDPVEGLHAVWIVLDNPGQLNSYTTDMVKEVILAFPCYGNGHLGALWTAHLVDSVIDGHVLRELALYLDYLVAGLKARLPGRGVLYGSDYS
jgi:hypothetical protein